MQMSGDGEPEPGTRDRVHLALRTAGPGDMSAGNDVNRA